MNNINLHHIHPLLQKIINRIVQSGVGEVIAADDGHLFVQTCNAIKVIHGALDLKKEGDAAGVRVVVRKVKKRAKNSKYAGMPMLQLYVLPIVQKNAQTMTHAERRNMEINAQTLRMAHAVERDPQQAAYYHELHEAHKLNPVGYKKIYQSFFGFLVATFRVQLENAQLAETAETQTNTELTAEQPAHNAYVTRRDCVNTLKLCVPFIKTHNIRQTMLAVPKIRYPVAA